MMTNSPEEDYLTGLANLRSKIKDIDSDIKGCVQTHPSYLSEQGWTEAEYKFTACLQFLESKNLLIERIDHEGGMLSMINDLRATGADSQLISYTTSYWDDFHSVIKVLREVTDKFHIQVLSKLRLMFSNHMTLPNLTAKLAEEYNSQVSQKISTIDKLYHRLITLSQTFQSKVDRDLFESGANGKLIIVRLPRDVIIKLHLLISLSNDLLNREEKFIKEMASAMSEYRKRKNEYDRKLSDKREIQLAKINNVNLATLLLDKNKEMLEQLDNELDDLQTQLANKENDLNLTEVEIERDQNNIEFLNHTIATTKRNQRLLIKRQTLLKTRLSLEKKLEQIKEDLQTVNKKMQDKTTKKEAVKTTLQETEVNHKTVSEELSTFTGSIDEMEREVRDIHTDLIDMEILHCIKTSPENIDEIRDRPQSVKIAKSLRAKITKKRLKPSTNVVIGPEDT